MNREPYSMEAQLHRLLQQECDKIGNDRLNEVRVTIEGPPQGVQDLVSLLRRLGYLEMGHWTSFDPLETFARLARSLPD